MAMAIYFGVMGTGAKAAVVGGSINLAVTPGIDYQTIAPPPEVGQNNHNDPTLYAFNELQGVTLGNDLFVDGGTISAGTRVNVHYVFFDPLSSSRAVGDVTFSDAILGVISSRFLLVASDFLRAPSTTYNSPFSILRGLESNDSYAFLGDKLFVDFRASSPGDYIRVVTAVPIPPAILLFFSALVSLTVFRRRRRRALAAEPGTGSRESYA
jgi:hypothetical protein